jgi:hypothetical protein
MRPITMSISERSVRTCDLEQLKQSHLNKRLWDEKTCAYAAQHGAVDCLQYAHDNGCPWNELTLYMSVSNGRIECVKYFLENVPIGYGQTTIRGYRLCQDAAYNGHADVLQYLHEQGYTWNKQVCILSAERGYTQCMKYAYEHGCEAPLETCLSVSMHRQRLIYIQNNLCNIMRHKEFAEYIKTLIQRKAACVKIQSAIRGVLTRNTTGVHNPHTPIGKQFLFKMFYRTLSI